LREIQHAKEAIENLESKVDEIEKNFSKVALYDKVKRDLENSLDCDKIYDPRNNKYDSLEEANLWDMISTYITQVRGEVRKEVIADFRNAYLGTLSI